MKTETEVNIEIGELRAEEALANEVEGFVVQIFFACSKVSTKTFRLNGLYTPINQNLRVSNIGGKELEFWLCTMKNKIIANAVLPLPPKLNELQSSTIQLKITNTTLAHLSVKLSVSKRQIQKLVYVQPDEQLLKKVQNQHQKQLKEQQQLVKQKQLEQQQNALKQVKKPPITFSKFNKKDVPFI